MTWMIDLSPAITFFNTPLGGDGGITIGIVAIILVIMLVGLKSNGR